MARFSKPPLSHDAQLDRLIERGMTVPDRGRATHYLSVLNYYRLGAYWLPFEANHTTHAFRSGTSFDAVLDLYVFDRELRLLVMDALERIEIAVRTAWAYHMAHTHGPHCHLDRSFFKRRWPYERRRATLEEEVNRNQETFIRHLRAQYDEPLPPIWALVEVMTFGQLSQWYGNTSRSADRNAVARQFGLDESILTSLMHQLTMVRNVCAHHSRLWNREFTFQARVPNRNPDDLVRSLRHDGDRRIYNPMTFMLYLLDKISPEHHWRERFDELLAMHHVDVSAMGFPPDWRKTPLWRPGRDGHK